MSKHNTYLAAAAKNAGVQDGLDYAIFQNHGYMGLYGGLDARGIHDRKGLKKSQQILDHMGSTELAANLFRAENMSMRILVSALSEKVYYFSPTKQLSNYFPGTVNYMVLEILLSVWVNLAE